ncbi:MAG TPA: hypothetical protein VK786_05545 [bacterium]|jgi:hypothetical protein|nr:hypothetical protein [bacterium]
MPKTTAEQQIETLKRMKETHLRPDAAKAAGAKTVARVKPVRSLPVGREIWKRLQDRQASTREFRGKKEMGEWAARLLLALPARAHTLDAEAREDLFRRMREWCALRGLK